MPVPSEPPLDNNDVGEDAPRLIKVQVTDLLHAFNHTIQFPADWEFVILFGPNGVGKTRLLELVRAAATLNRNHLLQTPFEQLELSFDDGSELRFVKRESGEQLQLTTDAKMEEPESEASAEQRFMKCAVELQRPHAELITHELRVIWDERFERWLEMSTNWRRFDGMLWRDLSDGEILNVDELFLRYGHIAGTTSRNFRNQRRQGQEKIPPALTEFVAKIPIHLIETQRLMLLAPPTARGGRDPWDDEPSGNNYVSTVTQHSDDLRNQLAQTVTAHSRLSQQLDRTFPKRIIEEVGRQETDSSIRLKYQSQNELRTRLSFFSLIDAQGEVDLPERQLEPFEVKALSIYLSDTERKLEVFTGLLERLELFVDIMNSRLVRKRVSIDVNTGISVQRDSDHEPIPTERLSSGEQHEMVLLYGLLFRTDPNSVVLVDEPEISLHVAWQKQFLTDILKIARLSSLRFIIATHSPQIIDEWWRRTNELSVD